MKLLTKSWWIFINERFHIGVHLPMVLVFSMVNYFVPIRAALVEFDMKNMCCYFIVLFCFFFRMRVFDEIKDFEVDKKINPMRPLARGLISIRQARVMIFCLYIIEALLMAMLGGKVLLIYMIPAFYSLLMFEEFFIGDYLRPHLTTYAITHTFVSVLLGYLGFFIAIGSTNISLNQILFLMMNWCFFNLFEFARKSFAADEERPNVESYSKIFKTTGALILSASQSVLGTFLSSFLVSYYLIGIGAFIYSAIVIYTAISSNREKFNFFRNATGAYLIIHYCLVFISAWRG